MQIAEILSGHARAVGAPLTIYLDVRPADAAWADLVQELARLPQIRVLVTIREEDWRRARLNGAAVAFEEIELTLVESEAQEIYGQLDRPGEAAAFLSFDEAWRRFVGSGGDEGPLMEFVYLVSRTETLRERLRQQVDAIRDAAMDSQASKAALDLLAMVSFASALAARIDLASLREHLPGLDLGRIVERLEREYLVRRRDEGHRLEGLHPVRSRLLADILGDGFAQPGLICHNLADAAAALPRFQREFRRLFERSLPGDGLDDQDHREQKAFDSVLPLFTAYLFHPTAQWAEPERRATAMMWHAINRVPQRLVEALASLEQDGIHAKIMKVPDRWGDVPALWISLDSDDPLHVLTAPAMARPLLRQGILNAVLNEEQTRMLWRRWEQLVLVPLFRGSAL